MKSRLVLISAVLATTAGLGVSGSALAGEKQGNHPAELVAKAWATRGIDPNTFIVAHPSGQQVIEAATGDKAPRVAGVR